MIERTVKFIRTHLKTLLFFGAAGLVGGFFTGLYLLDSYPAEIRDQIYAQGLNDVLLGVVTAVQAAGYGVVLGALGIALGTRAGLFKNERTFTKKNLTRAIVVAVVVGLSMILFDLLWFCKVSDAIMDSYATKPGVVTIIAGVIYGGVIEEVMLRLFGMSLVALVDYNIFCSGKEKPSDAALALANAVTALLFAAGHLPATAALIGITPLILFRCFLLNGGAGVAFGWLYRKCGLRYAMIAHAGAHVVSKLIWIIFV